jgi:hypothetical protein
VIDSASVNFGAAAFSQQVTAAGSHQLVACYTGISNFLASCSAPLEYAAVAPYFLEQSNPSGVVSAPTVFVDKLKVIPAKGFSGVVKLTCQVSSDSCKLTPSSLLFTGDGKEQFVEASFNPVSAVNPAGLLLLPAVVLLGILTGRNRRNLVGISVFLCGGALLCLQGCGPVISIPVSRVNQTMFVNSTSGTYSQAVTYQLQVETDLAQ